MQHLAQINIAKLLHPIDDPGIAEFVNNLDRINALAERSKGFVWRLKDENDNATSINAFEDPLLIINMSVWESAKDLMDFVYKSGHVEIMRQRGKWFEPATQATMALWWVAPGHEPDVEEAKSKLEYLQTNGESEEVFTFKKFFQKTSK